MTYASRRVQFGHPLARSQLVQDKLARMLVQITLMQLMCARLAKLHTAAGARRICAEARDILGGTAFCSITTSRGTTPTSRRCTPTTAPTPCSR